MNSFLDEWRFLAKGKQIAVLILLPIIGSLIFGYVFSNNQINEAPIAVIDQDNSVYSRQLIMNVEASQYMKVKDVFHTAVSPDTLLYNEHYLAVLYLPQGLEQNRYQGKQSNIGFFIDNTVASATTGLRTGITEVITTENTAVTLGKLKAMGLGDDAAGGTALPINLQQRILYNPTNDFLPVSVIGFVCSMIISTLSSMAGSVVPRLRQEGLLQRELSHPVGLLLRLLPYAFVASSSMLLALSLLKQVGGMRFEAMPHEFFIPLLLFSVNSALLGMLVGWSATGPDKVSGRIMGIVIPSFLLSGTQVAVLLLPGPLQVVSNMLPITWLFRFIRGMGFRGGSIGYFWVEIGYYLMMTAVLCIIIALLMLRETRKIKQSSPVGGALAADKEPGSAQAASALPEAQPAVPAPASVGI
ncbi:ABC transporter permease [Paenibacillus sp. y28]|uniref:ABC transporter permease n=1 Tax=Paenibacillus sp. y28 TaxID=3129110 RepID=UPI003019F032